mmetsp:Transcript_6642/g.23470  ORF Transcript_6642/g.23470 Transcript_6642/m.23470 type:complete len:329 (-) Transcript_6642:270-1256(-)
MTTSSPSSVDTTPPCMPSKSASRSDTYSWRSRDEVGNSGVLITELRVSMKRSTYACTMLFASPAPAPPTAPGSYSPGVSRFICSDPPRSLTDVLSTASRATSSARLATLSSSSGMARTIPGTSRYSLLTRLSTSLDLGLRSTSSASTPRLVEGTPSKVNRVSNSVSEQLSITSSMTTSPRYSPLVSTWASGPLGTSAHSDTFTSTHRAANASSAAPSTSTGAGAIDGSNSMPSSTGWPSTDAPAAAPSADSRTEAHPFSSAAMYPLQNATRGTSAGCGRLSSTTSAYRAMTGRSLRSGGSPFLPRNHAEAAAAAAARASAPPPKTSAS